MGANPEAIFVLGIKIPESNLFNIKKVKTFKHNYSEDMSYDPKTGKKLWKDEEIPVLPEYELGDNEWRQFKIAYDESDNLYFGTVGLRAGGYEEESTKSFTVIPNEIGVAKRKLKEALEPFELWNENDFGFHLIHRWNA